MKNVGRILVCCCILPLIACMNSITSGTFEPSLSAMRSGPQRAPMISGRLTGMRSPARQMAMKSFTDDDYFFDELFPPHNERQISDQEILDEHLDGTVPSLDPATFPMEGHAESLLDDLDINWHFSPKNGALISFDAIPAFYHSWDHVSVDFYACPSSLGWYTVSQALGKSGGPCKYMGHEEVAAASYQKINMRFDLANLMDQDYANLVLNSVSIFAVISKPYLHARQKFFIASPSLRFEQGKLYKIPREPLDYQRLVFLTPPKDVQQAIDILRPDAVNIVQIRERYSEMRLSLNNIRMPHEDHRSVETVADADTNPYYVLGKTDRTAALNRIKDALEILEEYSYYNDS